jgi:hypothetical protein
MFSKLFKIYVEIASTRSGFLLLPRSLALDKSTKQIKPTTRNKEVKILRGCYPRTTP